MKANLRILLNLAHQQGISALCNESPLKVLLQTKEKLLAEGRKLLILTQKILVSRSSPRMSLRRKRKELEADSLQEGGDEVIIVEAEVDKLQIKHQSQLQMIIRLKAVTRILPENGMSTVIFAKTAAMFCAVMVVNKSHISRVLS